MSDSSELLEKSKKPFSRDENVWKGVLNYLREKFSLEGGLNNPISPNFLAIDASFKFEPHSTDNEYSFFHVEYLLDHAADLLDRGLKDRAEWNELAVKAFNLGAELTEFFQLDEIHKKEIEAGFYSLSYTDKQADADAEKAYAEGNKSALEDIENLLTVYLSDTAIADQKNHHSYFAIINGFPPGTPNEANWPVKGFTGTPNLVNYLEYLGGSIFENEANSERYSYLSQKDSLQAAKSATELKNKALQEIADYEKQNIEFSRGRTEVSRSIQDLRAKAATCTGGILNYIERMEPIKKRFERDFREAIACLIPAYVGLVDIYGYDEIPLPNSSPELSPYNYNHQDLPTVNSAQFFDDCLIWTRDAVKWMVQFQQKEQSYVLPFSLKSLINNDVAWGEGIRLGKWQFEIPDNFQFAQGTAFADNTSFFTGQRHVRLRGISAFVETSKSADVWRVLVKVPQASNCAHLSGNIKPLDQASISPCRLGRVTNRDGVREPDIVGVSALHNVSPFGVWELELSKPSLLGVPHQEIRDVQIDLHIAMRSLVRQ